MFAHTAEVFLVFLRLGLTSFGGPIAHLGYFHDEFVTRRRWINEHAYADLVALCQFLPGPASSQVGIALGLSRAGYPGAIVAWLGFTLPSAVLLVLFAFGVSNFSDSIPAGALHGLKVAAVAVVAQAIWGMSTKLCPDKQRASVAVMAAVAAAVFPTALMQVLIIIAAGLYGFFYLRKSDQLFHSPFMTKVTKKSGAALLVLFFTVLIFSPLISQLTDNHSIKLFESFFRAGSLVFGGGHVVLPLLKNEVVNSGWVTNDIFLAGYGAAQAIPGPLFTFSAYLGAVSKTYPSEALGAALCLLAAFLPSFLIIIGVLPFWEHLRKYNTMKFAIHGINAAVVGLLVAAFYSPVWTSGILNVKNFSLFLVAFLLLVFWKKPSWLVVLMCALAGGF